MLEYKIYIVWYYRVSRSYAVMSHTVLKMSSTAVWICEDDAVGPWTSLELRVLISNSCGILWFTTRESPYCQRCMLSVVHWVWIKRPLSSNRQHLSYDVCLEVRGEIIRTVLCCIVYWNCAQSLAHLDEQFLQFSGLGFVTLGPFHCA